MSGRSSQGFWSAGIPSTRRIESAYRCVRSWTVSSTGVAPAVSGTNCPRSLATTAPCIGISKPGAPWTSSTISGASWCSDARNWTASNGSGSRPMRRWATPWASPRCPKTQSGRIPQTGEKGVKRSIVVDGDGGPLGVVIAGANVHDTKLLADTLEVMVLFPPPPPPGQAPHLCSDKGYDNPTGHDAAAEYGYTGHIRRIGDEPFDENHEKRHRARR